MVEDCRASSLPIVVDVDGTLIKTDLLFESANQFVTRRPLQALRIIAWLAQGKSQVKARLAEATQIDVSALPCNERLLQWLRQKKSAGRTLVLATASHRLLAERVAAHLGIFDAILATEGGTNLNAQQKRDLLVRNYGIHGFDYVGNDWDDMVVWESAAHAYVVGNPPALITEVERLGNFVCSFEHDEPSKLAAMARALRPQQWMKNLLVLAPLFAAHRYDSAASVLVSLLAFAAFTLTASSGYLLNDLVDVTDDRHHPRKRGRPFAAGQLSLLQGWLMWPLLLLLAFAMGTLISAEFVAALVVYFCLTVAYSLRLKQIALIDVLTLAALYTLRIIAGAAAIAVPLSFRLLTFSMFIFLSLAFMKRFSEIKSAHDASQNEQVRGRGYFAEDLELLSSLGTVSGYIAVLVLALYIQDGHTADLYREPKLIWLACPLLLYWISRAWLIAHRGGMHDDPVVFTLRDRLSWLVGALFAGIFALARFMP